MADSDFSQTVFSRRRFLRTAAIAAAGSALSGRMLAAAAGEAVQMPFANGDRRMAVFPQKRRMIVLTSRPPQLETPFSVFNESVLTPNDAFFVRYHLAGIPTSIDPDQFKLEIKGSVNSQQSFSLDDLRMLFTPVELVAVNQCSGNSRGFSQPRVPGGQSGNGAMGNARWRGARLKDVLEKAGVAVGAKQVAFRGLDGPVLDTTPAFAKALDVDHALDGEVMLAYEMNGQDLPMLNGYPLRLIVPGYYGTYWVKHLHEITVLDKDFVSFWMDTAYRVPDNTCHCVEPGAPAGKTVPISRFNVRSFITSIADGEKIVIGKTYPVRGIAFDGGYGIDSVKFSVDDGKTWREAALGQDLGKYSFREWTSDFTPRKAGDYTLKVCASNRIGQTQPISPLWNPAGYMRNVIESTHVTAT